MKELANIGKMISIFIVGILYCSGWMLAGSFLDKKNNGIGVKIFFVIWLTIHGLSFIGFLIWSWI